MDLSVRPLARDELGDAAAVLRAAFGDEAEISAEETPWSTAELDRSVAVFDGDDMVGVGRAYSLDLVAPGGVALDVAGVSWVGVLPTHRRRGVLRAIMRCLHDEARARREVGLVLVASESSIYGRFGYGPVAHRAGVSIDTRHAAFRRAPAAVPGRLRMVSADDARRLLPGAFARARAGRPGSVGRPDPWWDDEYFDRPAPRDRFHVVHEDDRGVADGYLTYRVSGGWEHDTAHKTAEVIDLVAADHEVAAALWRLVLDLDLVERVHASNVALDDPIRWRLADPRRLRTTKLADSLWLRVLDVPGLLGERTYATSGEVVVEVADVAASPDGPAASGRFRVVADAGGARCERTDRDADLVVGAGELAAVSLGGARWTTLARAGLVDERSPGALARADAMFASDPLPFAMTWF